MTEPLYYSHSGQTEFQAAVLEIRPGKNGCSVILDKTCFYPEGGGQPSDIGTIHGLPVQDVKKENGHILHVIKGDKGDLPFAEGDTVTGVIDPDHRRDYMEQHTGQHLVSAALLKEASLGTVSVHHGKEYVTIDVDREVVSREEIIRVESAANRVIRENHPVEIRWVDEAEAGSFNLRRQPKKGGRLRLVLIGGYDAAACGGLHTGFTGEVGLVKWTGMEKIRGCQRLYWKMGRRAYLDYREKTDVINTLNTLFSSRLKELPNRAGKVLAEQKRLLTEITRIQSERSRALAEVLFGRSREEQGRRIILHQFEGEDAGFIRKTLDALISRSRTVVCFVNVMMDGSFTWFIGCSEDEDIRFNDFRSEILPLIGGKGGGKPPLWQGVGRNPGTIGLFCNMFSSFCLKDR